ncbi:MAG: NUDIX hydrolase [Candidatus Harrisonbacteria bacterium CG10_big_fil_rev_8_21_14_0_10_49_15]|uniref:NUDIX hydrolase n=1 Tax=Candidatus Harrisonbacteria bacterium CG10_big_fil_rev_8_21_14_0_10_49_15 TaxID=1974587 RepID=A0A2H0UKM9_9BACT|nr:MAG: NUDIX hydrolase [Candidatus Harrisonbacteria bacterium CG10_big_fil_rev_8_21_14_0_10_49_15]
MIYEEPPKEFNPKFEIVSCFVEHDGKMLLLHRHSHKSQGDRWGMPAGKKDPGETVEQAAVRELREETGIDLPSSALTYFTKTLHRYEDFDYIYHMFSVRLDEKLPVQLSASEHKEYQWLTPQEVLSMPKDQIMDDLDTVTKMFYNL